LKWGYASCAENSSACPLCVRHEFEELDLHYLQPHNESGFNVVSFG